MFPGLTGVPSARSPGANQGSRVTRRRPVLGSRPGRSGHRRSRRLLGAGRRPQHPTRADLLHLLRGGRRGSVPLQQKGAPWRARRPAPPRPGFPRPRPRPRGKRSGVTASRYPEGGGGEATTIQRAGGRRGGKARRRAPRQRGAGLRAVPPRHWSAPPRRPPRIGECSNSVSRRQRRCFSGDRDPGLGAWLRRVGDAVAKRTPRVERRICEPYPALPMSPGGR